MQEGVIRAWVEGLAWRGCMEDRVQGMCDKR